MKDCNIGLLDVLHKSFVLNNKRTVYVLDLLFVLSFLFNIGATGITNYLSVKQDMSGESGACFYEINPVQQNLNDYDVHPEQKKDFKVFTFPILKQLLIWIFLTIAYVRLRFRLYTYDHLVALTGILLALFVVLLWDFVNDLGYLLAVIL